MNDNRCQDCGRQLSLCGEPGPDGIPTEDCRECKQEGIIADLHEKIAKFEQLAGVYAQLLMANHALEDRAVLLLGGLIEITKIQGNPPIQVARTIAQRCIDACKEQITAHEPTLPDQIHGDSRNPEGSAQRQA